MNIWLEQQIVEDLRRTAADVEDFKRREIMLSGKYEQTDTIKYYANIVGYCKKVAEDPDTSVADRLKAMEVGMTAGHYQLIYQQWYPDAPLHVGEAV